MKIEEIQTFKQPDLDALLEPGEKVLWTGTPGYGRRFWESVGHERTTHICILIGVLALWCALPFVSGKSGIARQLAVWVFGFATIIFACTSLFLATKRRNVLQSLIYFVTDRRSIIGRRARNWRLATRLYVVSFPHSDTYPYSLIATKPHLSVQIGTLLSVDLVQPFGSGLAHPGHSILRNRISSPVTFDYLPDAQAVLSVIQTHAQQK